MNPLRVLANESKAVNNQGFNGYESAAHSNTGQNSDTGKVITSKLISKPQHVGARDMRHSPGRTGSKVNERC